MNWFSYAPFSWKVATLKSLVKRAFLISSKTQFLDAELEHITETFTKKNDYPNGLVQEIIRSERLLNAETTNVRTPNETESAEAEEQEEKPSQLSLILPYTGKKGEELVKKVKKYISNSINKEKKLVSMQATYRARRLGSNFNIKDKISLENQHNVVYHAKCPNRRCKSHYNGQTKCRIGKRAVQHGKEDKQSHLYKHANHTKHKKVDITAFKIIGRGYRSDFTRKISESLFIKKLEPNLNAQKDSYKLLLFN